MEILLFTINGYDPYSRGWWMPTYKRIESQGEVGTSNRSKVFFAHKEEEEVKVKGVVMEDVMVIIGLIVIQFVYSGNSIMLSYLMSLGLNPLTFAITCAFASCLFLSPLAFLFERSLWPNKFSLKLIILLVSGAIGGVTLYHSLFMRGIKLTSAAMGTAMPNLCPGLIFVIAWITGFEKVDLSCVYSKVKILGTVLCVSGALVLSMMHSKVADEPRAPAPSAKNAIFDEQKIVGCLYLLAAMLVQSIINILQAVALIEFPAPMSICAISSLLGVLTTSAAMLLEGHGFDMGWPYLSLGRLVFFSFLGGAMSAGCLSFNGWAIKKRGPVLASIFSPIATVCSVLYSVMTSQETISLPSLGGMVLMFTGLYLVLWSKGKEKKSTEFDEEKPLLS